MSNLRSLFGYMKDAESSAAAAVPGSPSAGPNAAIDSENAVNDISLDDPGSLERSEPAHPSSAEPVAPGSPRVVVEVARPRDPSAGPHEHASGVRAAGPRVTFADAPETTDPGIPPVSSWCRRCVRLIGRDP